MRVPSVCVREIVSAAETGTERQGELGRSAEIVPNIKS